MDDPGHEKAHRQAALPDAVGPSVGLSKQQTPKRKYVQVEYEKRRELIQVITREHLTIKSAAEKLNINYPTAKNIVKLYRREQRIEKLPKRPNLTIKKITSPTPKSGDALYNVVLSPFYNEAEAERIMGRHRHDPRMSGQTSQELQAGSDRERQVARTSVTSAQSSLNDEFPGPDGAIHMDFLVYAARIMQNYLKRLATYTGRGSGPASQPLRTLPSPFGVNNSNATN